MSPAQALVAYGRVTSVRDVKSLGVTRVTIELPLECHVQATSGFYDQVVALTRVDLPPGVPYGISAVAADTPAAITEKPPKKGKGTDAEYAPSSTKPFGAAASLLYKPHGSGIAFLAIPRVQQAVGLPEQVSDLSLVSATLAEQFGCTSLGFVDPARVIEWATSKGVAVFLPRLYKQCQSERAA